MLSKKFLVTLSVLTVLTVPAGVFAATSDTTAAKEIRGFFGWNHSQLTDKQKANLTEYTQKSADLQKDLINKMVADGALTKEQGDAQIQKIEEALKNGDQKALMPGFFRGKDGYKGFMGGPQKELFNIDFSKLTDTQKADIQTTLGKLANEQKSYIAKMLANGLMTKEQGDAATKNIDEKLAKVQKEGLSDIKDLLKGGLGALAPTMKTEKKSASLTEAQKADLDTHHKNMSALLKEGINQLVANGTLTKEQGDKLSQMTDKPMFGSKAGPMKQGFGKGRGHQKDSK